MNLTTHRLTRIAFGLSLALAAAALAVGAGVPANAAPVADTGGTASVVRPQGLDKSGQPLQAAGFRTSLVADVGPPISRANILARAQTWADAGVPYSQNVFRDGYRTDCSGYVSMAWATNSNYWTGNLNTIGIQLGGYSELRPGDMLLYHNSADPVNGSHVVIFDRWTGAAGGDFYIYEQTPPSTKHRLWSQAGYSRSLYIPFKYVNVTESTTTQVAFQANTTNLWTVGDAGNRDFELGMAPGTSPSITALPGGGHEFAFQANSTRLWTVGDAGWTDWGMGMMPGTSPSITALAGGGFEVAFQANSSHLWTVGNAGNRDWGLGMLSGTSPSITGLAGGGFEVAFQANSSHLWTVGDAGNRDYDLGMAPGTSPSITGLAGGGFEVAFQANSTRLWTVGDADWTDRGLGMKPGTSPSIGR